MNDPHVSINHFVTGIRPIRSSIYILCLTSVVLSTRLFRMYIHHIEDTTCSFRLTLPFIYYSFWPPTLTKRWGGQICFRSLRSIINVPPTFKTVAPPLPLGHDYVALRYIDIWPNWQGRCRKTSNKCVKVNMKRVGFVKDDAHNRDKWRSL